MLSVLIGLFECGTGKLSRNVGKYLLICVTSRESEDLKAEQIYSGCYGNRLSGPGKHFSDSGETSSNDELMALINCLVVSVTNYLINNRIVAVKTLSAK